MSDKASEALYDWQTPGCTRYGAQMGRNRWKGAEDYLPHDTTDKLHLRRVYLDSGGYDQGGAYWGHGEPLWCLWKDEEGRTAYVRAGSREMAKVQFPMARFYR